MPRILGGLGTMFQPWRIKLRAAEEAFRGGRYQEAGQLLNDSELRAFLPAKQLLAKVADKVAERGRTQLAHGESRAGWRDLETAMQWGASDDLVGTVRQELLQHALVEIEALIAADEPTTALDRLQDLERHHTTNAEVRSFKQVAQRMEAANRLARSGKFAEAEQLIAGAVAMRPGAGALTAARQSCQAKGAECRKQTEELHAALLAEQWTKVLAAAEAILALAPAHEQARDARRRAWQAVGIGTSGPTPKRLAPTGFAQPTNNHHHREHVMASAGPLSDSMHGETAGSRFLLWVDGVGGFLVCESDTVTIGQPGPGNEADIAILADISRNHARIRRGGEGYLLEPVRELILNGRTISAPTTLVDGALIDLGGVRLRFRRPHALSATARLEFVSRHRTLPAADAILLMSESCVLGPGSNNHVVCRDWRQDVVLARHDGQLSCRTVGRFEVDGVCCEGRGAIERNSQIVGDDFSLSLEPV